jgi:hypothetical protein
MRWTRLLSVDARSLLRDSHQISTGLNDLTRTYCSPMMVNLKCPSMYSMIGGMREHNIVVCEVVRKGGRKCFGITPKQDHFTVGISGCSACRGSGIFNPSYMSLHCMSKSSDSGSGQWPCSLQNKFLTISGYIKKTTLHLLSLDHLSSLEFT